MGVTEPDRWNELLDDFQQILFRPLPDFSGGQGRRRMRDEQRAEAFLHSGLPDQRVHAIREIDDFFETAGPNVQHVCHRKALTAAARAL